MLTAIDTHTSDLKLALRIFFIGTTFLIAAAALGLTTWPAFEIYNNLKGYTIEGVFDTFSAFGLIFIASFWSSCPTQRQQITAIITWPIVTLFFIVSLRSSIFFEAPLETLICGLSIPCAVLLLLRITRINGVGNNPVLEERFRKTFILLCLFMTVPGAALRLSASLHPETFDLFVLRWDSTLGLNFTPALKRFTDQVPGLPNLLFVCYGYTPLAFLAVAMLHLHKRPSHVASGMVAWVTLTTMAIVAYNFLPVTGPLYITAEGHSFVELLNNGNQVPLATANGGLASRNGMPSMHFGWMLAATILWWRTGTRLWSRCVFIAMTFLTAIQTLVSGEHYVADLIVAAPFVLAGIALATTNISIAAPERRNTIMIGLITWIIWIIAIRQFGQFNISHPWFGWLLILATALVVVYQARNLAKFPQLTSHDASPDETASASLTPIEIKHRRTITAIYFFSGCAALIYQVVFAKKLALIFGSTSTATLTVLATFLGGMAIGSLLGGKLADKSMPALKVYAIIEALIGIYCAATPLIYDLIQTIYISIAANQAPDSPELLGLRIILGAGALLVPTILMGASLPVLTKSLKRENHSIGQEVATLYFANTAGAAVGALMTSYFIIPSFGILRTALLAVFLNLLVAIAALQLLKKQATNADTTTQSEPEAINNPPHKDGIGFSVYAAYLALGVGGFLSLGLEVSYVHMLSIVAGNSVYAFGLMLAAFLFGLATGGHFAKKAILTSPAHVSIWICLAFLGLSLTTATSIWFWDMIPDYFASFATHPAARTFIEREAIRGMVCALIMLPPTIFIGASYVFAMELLTSTSLKSDIKLLGYGAAINTLGNILGVLSFGFLILPILGGVKSTHLIAFGALAMAILTLLMNRASRTYATFSALVLCSAMTFSAYHSDLDLGKVSNGANVYFARQQWGEMIDHAESIDGGLTSVSISKDKTIKTLLTNGKFQGNNAWKGEMQAQIGFALTPLFHQLNRERALVIGYGTGVTGRVFQDAGFKSVEIAELSGDVVKLANKHFAEVNGDVAKRNNVKIHVTDGRNFLMLAPADKPYDVISIEISSIWFAGAASLYNQEFYKLAKSRLADDGVLQQWVQLHHLNPTDILSIITTLRSEFQYVTLYTVGGQGILIATNHNAKKDQSTEAISALKSVAGLESIRQNLDDSMEVIAGKRMLTHAQVDRYITEIGIEPSLWISTDDNAKLEYSTPKANANDSDRSFTNNISILTKFRQK